MSWCLYLGYRLKSSFAQELLGSDCQFSGFLEHLILFNIKNSCIPKYSSSYDQSEVEKYLQVLYFTDEEEVRCIDMRSVPRSELNPRQSENIAQEVQVPVSCSP